MEASRSTSMTDERVPTRVRGFLVGVVQDHPGVVAATLGLLVVAHAVLAWHFTWLSPYKALVVANNLGTTVTIYLFTAAAAALVAGLAGVIIVFVISGQTPQVRQFRRDAGLPLRRMWISVVTEPFVAAFLSVIAAVTQTTAGAMVGPWLFELGLALLAHSAVRLVLLLRELVDIVAADDELVERESYTLSRQDVFGQVDRRIP